MRAPGNKEEEEENHPCLLVARVTIPWLAS
jgi:hypothetical protein